MVAVGRGDNACSIASRRYRGTTKDGHAAASPRISERFCASSALLPVDARGKDPAAALQRAMIGMAHSQDTPLRDPALWAPFVVVGR